FLRGLYEADGTATQGVAHFSTVNANFVDEVRTLLLALGIPTSTKLDTSGWGQSDLHVLRVRNASFARNFIERVGFIGARKRNAIRFSDTWQGSKRDCVYVRKDLLKALVPFKSDSYARTYLYSRRHEGAINRTTATVLLQRTGSLELKSALSFLYDDVVINQD